MHCSTCNKNFNSAASILLHFSEHVKKPKKDYLDHVSYVNKDGAYEKYSYLSTNNNCYSENKTDYCDELLQDKDHKYNSVISTPFTQNKSSVNVDNKESDMLTNNCTNTCNESSNNATIQPQKIIARKIATSVDESFEDLDPSEYCVTLINEQDCTDVNTKSLISDKKEDNSLSNNTQKFKKKYACRMCSKIFGWSTDLKRHILIHTGERPFKCLSCNASFTRNFLLQKHLSKVHPCHISKEKLKYIEEGVELNLKLLRESFNIPKNVKNKA